jgi:V8-like Glu-specific endopeptidase
MLKFTRVAVSAACVMGMSAMALTSTASGASGAVTHKAAAVVGHVIPSANVKATLAYWTPARMRSAKDVSVVVDHAPVTASPAVGKPDGKAGAVAGGLPAGMSASRVAAAKSAVTPQAFSYPYPYDSFNVPTTNYKKFPWEVNGAIFFTNNGVNYVCSGTSVASVNGTSDENEVWTAGHCVANTEGGNLWDSSALFIPAYNGAALNFDPYGEFVAYSEETTSAWLYSTDFSVDEGAMLVGYSTKQPKNHRILGNLTGYDGFAWNWGTDEQFVTFGYPAASPYNGESMIEDIAATAVSDTGIGGSASVPPIGIGSPLTGGSSGGAWNVDWSDSGTGYINGHNDYKYSSQPLAMYSPYQDTLANTVRCFGASTC